MKLYKAKSGRAEKWEQKLGGNEERQCEFGWVMENQRGVKEKAETLFKPEEAITESEEVTGKIPRRRSGASIAPL